MSKYLPSGAYLYGADLRRILIRTAIPLLNFGPASRRPEMVTIILTFVSMPRRLSKLKLADEPFPGRYNMYTR